MAGTGSACHLFVLPMTANRFIWFHVYDQPASEGADGSGSSRGERRISPDLKLVVYSRSVGAPGGDVEYQLTNITREEPAAGLFEVPADYLEVRMGPMCWGGFDSHMQLTGCMSEPPAH